MDRVVQIEFGSFKPTFGFLYGSRGFDVVKVVGGKIERRSDHDLGKVYYARFSDGTNEFRWTEDRTSLVVQSEEKITGQYLLWGKVVDPEDGWCQLAEGRIRPFWIPLEAKEGDSIILKVVELLDQGEYGNWYVKDELMLGFGVLS